MFVRQEMIFLSQLGTPRRVLIVCIPMQPRTRAFKPSFLMALLGCGRGGVKKTREAERDIALANNNHEDHCQKLASGTNPFLH